MSKIMEVLSNDSEIGQYTNEILEAYYEDINPLRVEIKKMELILENNLLCRKMDKKKIDELEAKLEHKDYILDLWKRFVDTEYPEGKTLDAYSETLEEIEEGE